MKFNTINDLIRNLNLDKNHWINVEATRFIKRKSMDKVDVKLEHIPNELTNTTISCPNKHIFKLPWLQKRFPTLIFLTRDKGLLRQSTCQVKCPECQEYAIYNLKQTSYKGELSIYGDEAFRQVDGKKIFVYSFIGFSGDELSQNKFEISLLELKKSLAPSINPNKWILHMKEITSSEKRAKKKHLAHLTRSSIITKINRFLKSINDNIEKNNIDIYSAIALTGSDTLKYKDEVIYKGHVYTSSIMQIVSELTSRGLAPKFYFEKTNSDGWAKNIFEGGRLTLLWSHLTFGIPVMTPKFVPPSESVYLEIADLISYIIARNIYALGKKVEGEHIETDFCPSQIGKIRYILTDARGNWNIETSEGFPFARMFKNTTWEKYI